MAYCGPRALPHSEFLSWRREDRDKALWWVIHERTRCSSCGTRPDEFEGDMNAFAAVPVHCRGCEIQAAADEEFEKHRKEYRRGTTIQLRRAEVARG